MAMKIWKTYKTNNMKHRITQNAPAGGKPTLFSKCSKVSKLQNKITPKRKHKAMKNIYSLIKLNKNLLIRRRKEKL